VSISGTYAIVGARREDTSGVDSGAAYIFERDTDGSWNQIPTILKASNAGEWPSTDEYFGVSVSISGNYAIVGAEGEDSPYNNNNSGAAYIFERTGTIEDGSWNQIKMLKASNISGNDNFGASVSISNNYAIVGAPSEDSNAVGGNGDGNEGAAYIFERTEDGSWNQVSTILKASNAGQSDEFGDSVSISGNYAIVGAENEDSSGTNQTGAFTSGAAYIYERDGSGNWGTSVSSTICNETKMLKATSNFASGDTFGNSVSIEGNYAIVGARKEDSDASGNYGNDTILSGAAYIFERAVNGSWNEIKMLKASDAEKNDYFGMSVSISDSCAIVGAYGEDTGAGLAGAAYIFDPSIIGGKTSIVEDWNGQFNFGETSDEVRISNRNITTNYGTYVVYSSKNDRNIAYNNNSSFTSVSSDYNTKITNYDNTLGSLRISTDQTSGSGDTNNNTWYIEFPTMQIDNTNLSSSKLYLSILFDNIGSGDEEKFYLQIKDTNSSWSNSSTSNQTIYYIDDSNDTWSAGNIQQKEFDITSIINGYNGGSFHIRLFVQGFQDNDYIELGSYLIETIYS
jgi:hypothetical protein